MKIKQQQKKSEVKAANAREKKRSDTLKTKQQQHETERKLMTSSVK